jgi:hypothetical protein
VVGFLGNDRAILQIRNGQNRFEAMVADGLHAHRRLYLAGQCWWRRLKLLRPIIDPIIGILIAVAMSLSPHAAQLRHRLMDAVDPKLVETVEDYRRA